MKFVITVVTILVLSACGLSSKREKSEDAVESQGPSQISTGLKLFEDGKYEEAHKYFDAFLEKTPVSKVTPSALYYSGLAYLELGKFEEARDRFQSVLKLSDGKDSYMQAEALYQQSRVFEGLNDGAKALAFLLDAERRAQFLKRETATIEVPARIATLYARQNQEAIADRYYQRAEKGLAELKAAGVAGKTDWVARVLYGMGRISPRSVPASEFDGGLRSVRRAQGYLLRSVEENHSIWSARAQQEIEVIYNSLWKVIESTPLEPMEDKLAALRLQQDRMIEMGLSLNGALSQLQQEMIPGFEPGNQNLVKLKTYLEQYESRLEVLIASRPVTEGLTPEAMSREGIMREGRVIDPVGVLEGGKKRLEEKLPAKKEEKK